MVAGGPPVSRRSLLVGGGAVLGGAALWPDTAGAQKLTARSFGARGDGRSDDTRALQAALDTALDVEIEAGEYLITDALRLRSGQSLTFAPGAVVRQLRRGRNAFIALEAVDVSLALNGGEIIGPGGYNAGGPWTGNQGWEGFRGLRFIGCRNVRVSGPGRIVNWGNAGIDFTGGSGLRCESLIVEGTHRFGERIAPIGNFQNGIYVTNDRRFGACDALSVTDCTISGVAQGLLREAQPHAPAPRAMSSVVGCRFVDIPGQHGVYNQDSLLDVRSCSFRGLGGSAVKNQAGDAGRMLTGISASAIDGQDLGVALFELAEVGGFGGGIEGARLSGTGHRVGFLAAINGRILRANVSVSGGDVRNNAVYVQGSGARALDITVDAEAIDEDGVLITARDADAVVRATIREPNRKRLLGGSGIRVSSRSARVTLQATKVSDRNTAMRYGVFNDTLGATVTIGGAFSATGASDHAIRATGQIGALPAAAVLEGKRGRIVRQ